MKLRCDLHLNGANRKLYLVANQQETEDHVAMKLAAYLLFWDQEPIVEASSKHPALLGQEFVPDVMALDDAGEVCLWIECGKVTMHKVNKLIRRFPRARIVIFRATEAEAKRLRGDMDDDVNRSHRVEVIYWSGTDFRQWMGALGEKIEIFGEAGGLSLNIVVNQHPLAADLRKL